MKQNRKFLPILCLVIIALVVAVQPVLAAVDKGLVPCGHSDATGKIPNPCTLQHLVLVVIRIINMLLGFSWLVATFFVFWGGWKIITAYGNSEGIENGKETLRQAIVGFFLVLVSFILLNFVIVSFTDYTFNFDPGDSKSIINFLPQP